MQREFVSPIAHVVKSFYIYAFMSIYTMHRLHFQFIMFFFFKVNEQRYQQFTGEKKKSTLLCVSLVLSDLFVLIFVPNPDSES